MSVQKSFAISLIVILLGAGLVFYAVSAKSVYRGIRAGHADENYLKSGDCRTCHEGHYLSWARTFHSRMTQEAKPGSIQGDFERNNTLEYLGVIAQMEKKGESYTMSFNFPDGRSQTLSVDRTVGSRRIEQYLTKETGQYTRLPVAYDLVNRRWMHLNGSFFYPDSENYFQHAAQWDANCVFCHNVKAQPHMDFATRKFATEVLELGIACGACHGPGAEHADAAASLLTRLSWRVGKSEDKKIVHPQKISGERSMMICGHCHGQRIPEPIDRIQTILTKGDPFNAGDDLAVFYKSIERDSHIGDVTFASRFWNDGSPRLTAYEYQGILRSQCFIKGARSDRINCLTCHTMHGGDPKGQITELNRSDAPCLSCHPKFGQTSDLIAHTKHAADSSGSRCYNCHMPRVVYGIMAFHRTHEITIPQPAVTASASVPNACNQCHLEKSVNWSITQTKRLWPERYATTQPSGDRQFDLPEAPRALFAGDALTRALAAEALGGGGARQLDPLWASPFLVEAFADRYPIVRFFAANGLTKTGVPWHLDKPDYLGPLQARESWLKSWREATTVCPADARTQARTLATRWRARREVDLEVGE